MQKAVFFMITFTLMVHGGAVLASDDVHTLEDITVLGEGTVSPEQQIQRIDIADTGAAVAATLPDVLGKTSGIDVQKRSVLTPKSSQVRIRGFDERRSLIMLDGRPLNGTGVMGGQFVDWSSISLQHWESVDVGKGAFSAKYGNTLGGIINLVPAKLSREPAATAAAGYQRYDTWSLDAAASGRTDSLGGRFSAGYLETDGHLRNSEAERVALSGEITGFWGDDGEITAGIRYTDGDYGMPVANQAGTPGLDPRYPESIGSYLIGPGIRFPTGDTHGDNSTYTKKRTELDLGVQKQLAGVDAEVKLYFNTEDRTDTITSYDQGVVVLERDATPDRSWGWVARCEKAVAAHRLGAGIDGNYQGYGGTENTYVRSGYFPVPPTDGGDEWDGTRWHGAYVDDQWALADRLDLYVGLRYEDYYGDRTVDQVSGYSGGRPAGYEPVEARFDEEVLLPKLGMVYRPADGLSLFGRFARATRFPDNPAFYWYYGGYRPEVDPDSDVVRSDLTYEDALQYEAGATFTGLPGLRVSLSGYTYRVDDYIRWIFGYSPSRVVYNIDQVEFTGVELDMEGRIWNGLSAFFNFTWQDTRKTGDVLDASNALSDSLSELPDYKFNAGIQYRRDDGLLATAAVRWVDDRQVPFIDSNSSSSPDGAPVGSRVTLMDLDAYAVVALSVRCPLWKGRTRGFLTAGVDNLFDERYEEEYGFPAMGQTFFISAGFEI
ncbi:hypothetical protein DSCA_24970 [Desulfosarcina alkanivorans]|uniref:TonB-dependent receptor n=1 Tax=Desulfosarcina alkanivorans TaxID=571177 RepID=A0A5K7YV61_9BACT|nr:TonB-dependent receptor [Desulfosarcina alkanivorans]BBO68567.1 hypothetical protein DSCA_24970 [Desulfosarcina alkanivorans]